MMPERPHDSRNWSDRRRRPTNPWDAFRQPCRRARPRRDLERDRDYFVDRVDGRTFFMAVLLLVLALVDGALTLVLFEPGSEEINPAMSYLLGRGPIVFLLGKYALATAGLPFLLIYRHFTLFRTRFRVGHLLPVFVGMYLVLLLHQVTQVGLGAEDSGLEARDQSRSSLGERRIDQPGADPSRGLVPDSRTGGRPSSMGPNPDRT